MCVLLEVKRLPEYQHCGEKLLIVDRQKNFEYLMRMRDWEEGKIYFISDILFSKRIYFKKEMIKIFLEKNQFIDIKFLNRGIENDLSEKVHKNLKYKKLFGQGEIRLIAKKL